MTAHQEPIQHGDLTNLCQHPLIIVVRQPKRKAPVRLTLSLADIWSEVSSCFGDDPRCMWVVWGGDGICIEVVSTEEISTDFLKTIEQCFRWIGRIAKDFKNRSDQLAMIGVVRDETPISTNAGCDAQLFQRQVLENPRQ